MKLKLWHCHLFCPALIAAPPYLAGILVTIVRISRAGSCARCQNIFCYKEAGELFSVMERGVVQK